MARPGDLTSPWGSPRPAPRSGHGPVPSPLSLPAAGLPRLGVPPEGPGQAPGAADTCSRGSSAKPLATGPARAQTQGSLAPSGQEEGGALTLGCLAAEPWAPGPKAGPWDVCRVTRAGRRSLRPTARAAALSGGVGTGCSPGLHAAEEEIEAPGGGGVHGGDHAGRGHGEPPTPPGLRPALALCTPGAGGT